MLKRDHIKAVLSMDRIKKQWQEKYGQDFTEADVDKVYLESEKLIMKILYNFTKPKPYVIETVEELRNLGLKIGSTTGYTNGMMQIVTEKAKEAGYEPDFFITPNDVNNLDESTKERTISMVTNKYKEAGADYIVHDIREVLNIVKISMKKYK